MICENCGCEICDDDTRCEFCGANQIEEKCEVCGKWSYQLSDGVCNDCLIKIATPDTALMLGADERQDVSLNRFLAWRFSTAEIEELLRKELDNAISFYPESVREDCITFCLGEYDRRDEEYENAEWFAKWAREKELING